MAGGEARRQREARVGPRSPSLLMMGMMMMMVVWTKAVMVAMVVGGAGGAGSSEGVTGTPRPEGVTGRGVTRGGVAGTGGGGVTVGSTSGVTEPPLVRMVGAGGACGGLVQMRHGERWDALCMSGWNASGSLAEELCRGAGCGPPRRDAGPPSPRLYGGDLLYPSVRCLGESVSQCPERPVLRCPWEFAVTLTCEPGPAATTGEVTWPRVLGGWGLCQGHLEAVHAGSWRGVCAEALDAALTCTQLQCPTDEVELVDADFDPAAPDLDPYRWVAQAPCSGVQGAQGAQGGQGAPQCRNLSWSDVAACPGNRSAFITCRESSGPMLAVSWLLVSVAMAGVLALLTLRLVEWRPGLLRSVKTRLADTRDRLCLSSSRPRDAHRYSQPNPARWRDSLDYGAPGGDYGGSHAGAHDETHAGAHGGSHGGAHGDARCKAQWEIQGGAQGGAHGGAPSKAPGGGTPGGGIPDGGTPSRGDRYSVTPVEEKRSERHDSGSSMVCDVAELNGLLSSHGYRVDNSLMPPPGYLQALRTLTRPQPPGLTPPPSYLQALRILSRPMLIPLATHDPEAARDDEAEAEEDEVVNGGDEESEGLLARPVHPSQPGRESLL